MRTGACPPERPVREPRLNNAIQASVPLLQCLSVWIIQEIGRFRTASMRDALSFFPPPPSFHFLHPFFIRLINKTIRYRARYRRGNATFFFFSFFLLFFFFFFLLFQSQRNFQDRSVWNYFDLFRVLLSSCVILFLNFWILFESNLVVRIFQKKERKRKKEDTFVSR